MLSVYFFPLYIKFHYHLKNYFSFYSLCYNIYLIKFLKLQCIFLSLLSSFSFLICNMHRLSNLKSNSSKFWYFHRQSILLEKITKECILFSFCWNRKLRTQYEACCHSLPLLSVLFVLRYGSLSCQQVDDTAPPFYGHIRKKTRNFNK